MIRSFLSTHLRATLMLALLLAGTLAVAAPALGSTSAAASAPCPYHGGHPTLSFDSVGPEVEHAQCLINLMGFGPEIDEDGIFGKETLSRVQEIQGSFEMPADGIIGPCTWALFHPDDYPDPSCFR